MSASFVFRSTEEGEAGGLGTTIVPPPRRSLLGGRFIRSICGAFYRMIRNVIIRSLCPTVAPAP
jgi:hypothetical protein